LDLMHFSY